MNLQENIRRILREERSLRSKLLKTIDTVGFLPASNIVGGLEKLFDILGYDSLTDDMKIKLIKEIILETDDEYITLMDMNESPIIVHDENGVISQIEMLYPNDVALFHYGGYEYSQDLGETYRHYENLPKDILDDIFNMVVGYYLEVF